MAEYDEDYEGFDEDYGDYEEYEEEGYDEGYGDYDEYGDYDDWEEEEEEPWEEEEFYEEEPWQEDWVDQGAGDFGARDEGMGPSTPAIIPARTNVSYPPTVIGIPQDTSGWLDPFDLDNVATWGFCATVFFVAFNIYYGGFSPRADDWWAAEDFFA